MFGLNVIIRKKTINVHCFEWQNLGITLGWDKGHYVMKRQTVTH